ncbi:ubiquinone/menaquinone biosynthesisC-methyltransferase UbiE [Striga asiatica]|uniref:Ubiquinone/menaquinone biosynthesisC-methyltransferase UbiE n=1 Tax=Striga asiatica TaxID=4170 RepID=A0A5A7PXG7_STRAF|nr:ubiquinone/menaquinone biosynthesisC-methyltransferase UbiE [Striga asiatica]
MTRRAGHGGLGPRTGGTIGIRWMCTRGNPTTTRSRAGDTSPFGKGVGEDGDEILLRVEKPRERDKGKMGNLGPVDAADVVLDCVVEGAGMVLGSRRRRCGWWVLWKVLFSGNKTPGEFDLSVGWWCSHVYEGELISSRIVVIQVQL